MKVLQSILFLICVLIAFSCLEEEAVVEVKAPVKIQAACTYNCDDTATSDITETPGTGTPPFSYTYICDNGGPSGSTQSATFGVGTGPSTITCTHVVTDACGISSTSVNTLTVASCCPPGTINLQGDCTSLTWSASPFPCTTYNTSWYLNGVLVASNADPLTNLTGSGDYTAVVTCNCCGTASGCSYTSAPMNLNCASCTNPTVTISGSCTGLTSSISGTCPGASYQWFLNGSTISGATSSTYNPNGNSGSYLLLVNCSNGCSDFSNTQVLSCGCTDPIVIVSGDCNGLNGTIAVSNGCTPTSYNWYLNGSFVASTSTPSFTPTANGTWIFEVICANGCSDTNSILVTNCSSPCQLTASIAQSGCSLTAFPSSGTGPYTYAWSNGGSTQTINNLIDGTYTVTITDSQNCTATATFTVTGCAPACNPPTINSFAGNCTNGITPNISLNDCVSASYEWFFNGSIISTSLVLSGSLVTQNGLYSLTIICNNPSGCATVSAGYNITDCVSCDCAINFVQNGCNITASLTGTCSNYSSISIFQGCAGGTAIVTGTNSVTLLDATDGQYQAVAGGSNGCGTLTNCFTVTGCPACTTITATFTTTNTTCNSDNSLDGAVFLASATGTAPWTLSGFPSGPFSVGQQLANNLSAGSYSGTITDANGCTGSYSFTIGDDDACCDETIAYGGLNIGYGFSGGGGCTFNSNTDITLTASDPCCEGDLITIIGTVQYTILSSGTANGETTGQVAFTSTQSLTSGIITVSSLLAIDICTEFSIPLTSSDDIQVDVIIDQLTSSGCNLTGPSLPLSKSEVHNISFTEMQNCTSC